MAESVEQVFSRFSGCLKKPFFFFCQITNLYFSQSHVKLNFLKFNSSTSNSLWIITRWNVKIFGLLILDICLIQLELSPLRPDPGILNTEYSEFICGKLPVMDPWAHTYSRVLWLRGMDSRRPVCVWDSAVLAPVLFGLVFDNSCLMLLWSFMNIQVEHWR